MYPGKFDLFAEVSRHDIKRSAMTVVNECMGVKPGEKTLIVSDTIRNDLGIPLYHAALDARADTTYMEIKPHEMRDHEPPEIVSDAMMRADVILMATESSFSHTKARKKACENGARVASMPYGSHPEELVMIVFAKGGMTVDFNKMSENISRIMERLKNTTRARIVTEKGTDLTVDYGGREFHKDTGMAQNPGDSTNLPAGEVFVAPTSAQGTAIIDVSMGGFDLLSAPLELKFENGSIVSIHGKHAETLERLLTPFGDPARKIAEFAIGMNPKTLLSGIILEDEKAAGTAHIAIGNNAGFGGDNHVGLHKDGIIGDVTIYVDEEKLDLREFTEI
jgi:aminopeptidase